MLGEGVVGGTKLPTTRRLWLEERHLLDLIPIMATTLHDRLGQAVGSEAVTTSSKGRLVTCSLWCTVRSSRVILSSSKLGQSVNRAILKSRATLHRYFISNEGARITS